MKTFVIDNGSAYIDDLLFILRDRQPIRIDYGKLDADAIGPDDVVILSGGHTIPVLWHDDAFKNEINLIKTHKGPIIGVCLGFELIAHVYGSHLHQFTERRRGHIQLRATKKSNVTIPEHVEVFENHIWSVQKLKRPLQALAVSDDGVEILRHRRKPIYGTQFHPEKSSAMGRKILQDILAAVRR